MLKQKDQSKEISTQKGYVGNSITTLVVKEIIQESSNTKVEEKIMVEQTQLFYTKPFRKARKYDFF
ncbi:MAG TPA: hypothetical protein VFP87_13815 [Chitinophagaceae bacterium]|nr:hypothetical protein [Chitinophagaceae bacterium]